MKTFIGTSKRLEDIDIPRIASLINCGEDEIHAFMDVEAAGSGFDTIGRPKMLFEPHLFYRNLSGAQRDKAVSRGLAYPSWKRDYPKDSYPRLQDAILINQDAALSSTSWGLGQILGSNHMQVGYKSAEEMVVSFMEDEENHLRAIVEFLITNNIDDDLAAHRWSVVARVYNGPQYAANSYDVKMEKAYKKWMKIPDTEWEGLPVSKENPIVRLNDDNLYVGHLQNLLLSLGYKVGEADNKFGPKTEGQVKLFQLRNGLKDDGIVGPKTWKLLES